MMTEAKLTKIVVAREFTARGAVVYSLVAQQRQQPGLPDRMVYARPWRGCVEFKGPRTRVREVQRLVCWDMWRRCPGGVYVVRINADASGGLVYGYDGSSALVELCGWRAGTLLDALVREEGLARAKALPAQS